MTDPRPVLVASACWVTCTIWWQHCSFMAK